MNRLIRILLVDDDVRNSMLLRRFIEAEGYEVEYAPDGAAGLERYASFRPDLILLDINMPVMNGFELAARIRKTDRRVIIFFLTDRTEKADRLHGFSLRGNDYIPKPFYPEELMARIAERFAGDPLAGTDADIPMGDTVFSPASATLTYLGETRSLSARQADILAMLAATPGRPVARDTILNRVWGDASYANSLALNVQITYLRRLLTDPSITITSIKKRGYILNII